MKSSFSIPIQIYLLTLLAILCVARGFTFFYLVQQWPGTYCRTNQTCCHPKTGKPATDFVIHGLWPTNFDGSALSNCNPNKPLDPSQISDMIAELGRSWPSFACPNSDDMKLWLHEWKMYGTCSDLDQHGYFQAALNLKKKANLFKILGSAGIQPNGKSYSYGSISEAVRKTVGYEPGITCKDDKSGNSQLNQIYLCASPSGSKIIDCPGIPMGSCKSSIKFPPF
ncbi:hypothetical protein HHK36_024706 [Tetracentron sinense]|uniref:Uncharacterized protein n=1 Tax=Tetracentron sinense TaxID=13715 RepID=A0A835D7R1_TETSI|nr:hypothetical protein HHK36_024706 [Tetracentron sinense]